MAFPERRERPQTFSVEGAESALRQAWSTAVDARQTSPQQRREQIVNLLHWALTLEEAKERNGQEPELKDALEAAQAIDTENGRTYAKLWFMAQERKFKDELVQEEESPSHYSHDVNLTTRWDRIYFCKVAQQLIP
jgi:hypothetical protein